MQEYPTQTLAYLQSINGNSCGNLQNLMQFKDGLTPPQYREVVGQGDFAYAYNWQFTLADSTITWRLKIRYTGSGPCLGTHEFQRVTAADDPVGTYYKLVSGVPTQSAGEAVVADI